MNKKIELELEYLKEQKKDLEFEISTYLSFILTFVFGILGLLFVILYSEALDTTYFFIKISAYIMIFGLFIFIIHHSITSIKLIKEDVISRKKLIEKINLIYEKELKSKK